ncbi:MULTISPECIES: L-histidine N(alpha)-methyltransferase [Oscillatoriales]|uniref:L-histidine N(alpha)-methyltransferase n=1 Tax=Oscillatoriophycideae TaxID=1301283 RepID=UPI001685599E|nr:MULTISPECIES: L-histidine N(alpha)-methyltransferase [Oscillatoriales]
MKILLLSANPYEDLNLSDEVREIRNALEESKDKGKFEVIDKVSAPVDELSRILIENKPQIVHFCGHGNGEALIFESDKREEEVETSILTELFRSEQSIQCVVLNACYSERQAQELINHVDYVIGMKGEILDDAAIAFSKGFYEWLGYGKEIEKCYQHGCLMIRLKLNKLKTAEKEKLTRKLGIATTSDNTAIFEHLKPIMVRRTLSPDSPPETPHTVAEGSEELPDFLNHLLEDYFNKSELKWSLCFTGEDESDKLGDLLKELRHSFSPTGEGKQVPSGFSYWGIVSTLAWESTCRDPLYPVMRDGTSSFEKRWKDICNEEFTRQKYHYVSLGVGTGKKDNEILKCLRSNHNIRYFPVDMSSTMLRLGVKNATKNIALKGSDVLPIQIDFSIESNVIELRKLLDRIDNDDPILFSLLGNTLANFPDDIELLQTISKLMRTGDKLLLEVATTESNLPAAAEAAAKEYANTLSFKEFVTSTLLQYTNMNIDFANLVFEHSVEPCKFEDSEKALYINVLYRNLSQETISIMLPDWGEPVKFEPRDTIRLLTTRKYGAKGLDEIIFGSKLKKINSSKKLFQNRNNKYGFGMDLILLSK